MRKFPKGLIVSCQALEGNPLRNSAALARMAKAAEMGGAQAIRANGVEDIAAIREQVAIPIIGINKIKNAQGRVVITPTYASAAEVLRAGADILAIDATFAPDTLRENAGEIVRKVHTEHDVPVMADISTVEEARHAVQLGVDAVSTTLSGYMPGMPYASADRYQPDFFLLKQLLSDPKICVPIVAEGRFWKLEDVRKAFQMGVHAVVIGKAITNPMAITVYFMQACCKDGH